MTDQPKPTYPAISELASNEVQWDVPNIGKFRGKRMTGRQSMKMYRRRMEIIRSPELLDYQGPFSDLDIESLRSAEVIALLEMLQAVPVEDAVKQQIGWQDAIIDNSDSILLAVYYAYIQSNTIGVGTTAIIAEAQTEVKN